MDAMVGSTGRTAFVVLFVLNGSYSIFSAPTKEWKMPERTVVPESWNQMVGVDDIALSAAEEKELADFVEDAKRHVAGRILKDASGNPITIEDFEKFARKRFLPVVLHKRGNSLKFENGMPVVKHSDGNGELRKSRQQTSAPSVAKNLIESKNHVVMNQPVSGSAEAKPSAQTDEGWKWNGWKIASVVFLVLGIMGVKSSINYQERVCGVVSIAASGVLYYVGCSPDPVARVLNVLKIVAIGYGGLFFLACLISIVQKILNGRSVCKEKTDENPSQPDGKEIPYLDAGLNGEIRRKLQMEQQMLTIEQVKCRLYLPEDWSPDIKVRGLKVDEKIRSNALATLAGPGEHEWVTIRHLSVDDTDHGSGPGVLIDAAMGWILIDVLEGGIILKPHPLKAEGVRHAKRIVWDLDVNLADGNQYQKFQHADEEGMKVHMGVFEIEGRLYRIISVAFVRKNDCWRFEYAFPAADGVMPESLDLRAEEIEAARRIFVPIETFP